LEGKVLLSTGIRDPARVVHRATASGLSLKGVLTGTLSPAGSPSGVPVTTFAVKGNAGSMGSVRGTFALTKALAPGRQPNLSNATLTLSNWKGRVQLTIGRSLNQYYNYVITSGNGHFATASGSGLITLHFNPQVFASVVLVLHSHPN
jgi:hypothetical protein